MGRPLRKEFLNKFVGHYVKDGALTTGKIAKQVGFNKYVAKDGTLFRLCDRDEVIENMEANTGYVIATSTADGVQHSLFKLTTHQIECFDHEVYPFEYTFVIADGVRTGIEVPADAKAKIQGSDGEYDS